jgi:protoporphyrinogen oxidase
VNYLIIGGGISGLVSAHALLKGNPSAKITIVEKDKNLGGLLAGIEYKDENLYFDTGTHIFQETGNQELDQLLLNSVPSSDLIRFPIGQGDICGTVFNRNLQKNSHFPDLRQYKNNNILKSILKHLNDLEEVPLIRREVSLDNVATARFGKEFTQNVIAPIFEHTFGLGINSLSAFALLLTGWTRVIIDDEREWMCNSNNSHYRSLIAIPEQRNLPRNLHHGRRSFYSKSKGSKSFIQGLATSLDQRGVKILNNCTVTSFESGDLNFTLKDSNSNEFSLKPDKVIFSNGVIGAAKIIGVNLTNYHFEKPMRHRVIDVLLKGSCDSDLCYLLGLDKSCDWYRVTNYSAITGNRSDRRLTIEVLGDKRGDSKNLVSKCLSQLKDISFLKSSGADFSRIRDLPYGFPTPSVCNFKGIAELWLDLRTSLPNNVLLAGIGSYQSLFFQNEVVSDIYNRTLKFV